MPVNASRMSGLQSTGMELFALDGGKILQMHLLVRRADIEESMGRSMGTTKFVSLYAELMDDVVLEDVMSAREQQDAKVALLKQQEKLDLRLSLLQEIDERALNLAPDKAIEEIRDLLDMTNWEDPR